GECEALAQLIRTSLERAGCQPKDIEYINAHGTGTQQNDSLEIRGIRQALGRVADRVLVSSSKSMLGHLVNAAGSVELAITILALRDGFLPPTLNLTDPDPECDLDCIPLAGRRVPAETALKLSVAFGGHLAAVIVRRWSGKGINRSPASAPAISRRPASIYGEEYGGSVAQIGGLRPAHTVAAAARRHVG
ncbi:MAG TPA: hypothetical protein VIK18_24925, partial [Pirellulales bacterium]